MGITSTADLRNVPLGALTQKFGERNAKYMYYACRGEVVSISPSSSWTRVFMDCMHLADGLHTSAWTATMRDWCIHPLVLTYLSATCHAVQDTTPVVQSGAPKSITVEVRVSLL